MKAEHVNYSESATHCYVSKSVGSDIAYCYYFHSAAEASAFRKISREIFEMLGIEMEDEVFHRSAKFSDSRGDEIGMN